MIYELGDKRVVREEGAWIAPGAVVIGAVTLKRNASVWFNAVIRGDNDPIVIGENTNIQDGSVLHTDDGVPLEIGSHVTVGHKVMLHGCIVGDNSLIGINAVILNRAKIGRNCIIGANSLIPEGREIPDGSLVMGSPGKVIRQLSETQVQILTMQALHYVENARRYARDLKVQDA
ncbi:gamma carbonic anhydrase family protein [Zavarzinia compransoris]|uniref:Gamma carbonic anhydrase family protein n=1 Tax=Zavarzinia compransoris TaxID=1264899 RepID=A0A317EAI9_9PROT|nr:gamma carbonic anhydrase family protein [Zavarzinia compransoris]PWR23969.1 gamma carbonic anhydrase family protein [Zavarzinia compransoris]TDP48222.1 carbonic anhydrase/acetyltransferase-like protein (isoleucine patch superfamily) [Zavarzinia compransoris]